MSTGFVKIYGSILRSSVWQQPLATKVVWITMLALADSDGVVEASVPGLAATAGVSLEECKSALACFLSPDEYSGSKVDEGRRIRDVRGGWIIVNHEYYRELRTERQVREAKRIAQKRAGSKPPTLQHVANVADVAADPDPNTDPEREGSAEGATPPAADAAPPKTPEPGTDRLSSILASGPATQSESRDSSAQFRLSCVGEHPDEPEVVRKGERFPEAPTASATKRPKRRKPQTDVPENFAPNETSRALAAELGVQLAAEVTKFLSHHRAKGSLFADWQAALQTWIRKSAEFRRPPVMASTGPAPTTLNAAAERQRARELTQRQLRDLAT